MCWIRSKAWCIQRNRADASEGGWWWASERWYKDSEIQGPGEELTFNFKATRSHGPGLGVKVRWESPVTYLYLYKAAPLLLPAPGLSPSSFVQPPKWLNFQIPSHSRTAENVSVSVLSTLSPQLLHREVHRSSSINITHTWMGFSGGSVVESPPANTGYAASIPRLGRSPGGGHDNPL